MIFRRVSARELSERMHKSRTPPLNAMHAPTMESPTDTCTERGRSPSPMVMDSQHIVNKKKEYGSAAILFAIFCVSAASMYLLYTKFPELPPYVLLLLLFCCAFTLALCGVGEPAPATSPSHSLSASNCAREHRPNVLALHKVPGAAPVCACQLSLVLCAPSASRFSALSRPRHSIFWCVSAASMYLLYTKFP